MNFTHAEAEFLYSCVRCGIVHEGAPKVGVAFYLDPQNADATVIYKGTFPDRCIYLNVTAFARRYIEAVECIESGKITKACDFSMPPVDDRVDFDAAWGDLPDIGPLVMDAPQPYTSSSQSLRMPGEVLRIGLRVDPNP
jgi:hypothetical protein